LIYRLMLRTSHITKRSQVLVVGGQKQIPANDQEKASIHCLPKRALTATTWNTVPYWQCPRNFGQQFEWCPEIFLTVEFVKCHWKTLAWVGDLKEN